MTIIYDFDGVLFDSRLSVRTMYEDIAAICGRTLSEKELDYCYEHSMADNVKILGDNAWEAIKALPYEEYYKKVIPSPHVYRALARLKELGIRLCICSNRVAGIPYILDHYGMTKYFSNAVTSKDVPAKPNPDGLLSLIEGETYFVGDSEIDLKTASNAGIKFISYNNDAIDADYHISNHLEILSLTPIKEYGIRIARGMNGNN